MKKFVKKLLLYAVAAVFILIMFERIGLWGILWGFIILSVVGLIGGMIQGAIENAQENNKNRELIRQHDEQVRAAQHQEVLDEIRKTQQK